MSDEKKSRYSQAQNKATQKYIKSHYDTIVLRIPKGKKEEYKTAALKRGLSLSAFIVKSIEKAASENE